MPRNDSTTKRPFVDLTGRIFGRLTVLMFSHARGPLPKRYWTCRCECGRDRLVREDYLESDQECSTCYFAKKAAVSNHAYLKESLALLEYDLSVPWQVYPCKIWDRAKLRFGYGVCKIGKRMFKVHRLVYELTRGDIPEGMLVCHHCDVPSCWHPAHLFVASYAGNSDDMVNKGRSARGQRSPNATFTDSMVRQMRERYRAGTRIIDIASEFKTTHSAASSVVHRRSWKHIIP